MKDEKREMAAEETAKAAAAKDAPADPTATVPGKDKGKGGHGKDDPLL